MEKTSPPNIENRVAIKRPYFVETEFVLPEQGNLKRLLAHLNWLEDWKDDCLVGSFSTTLFMLDSFKILSLLQEMKKKLSAPHPATIAVELSAEEVVRPQSVTSPWSQVFTVSYPALAQEVEQFHQNLLTMTLRHAKQGATHSLLGCLFHDTRGAVLLRCLMQQLTDQQLGLQARMVQIDAVLKTYEATVDEKGLAFFQRTDFQAALEQETQKAFLWHLIAEDDREIKALFVGDSPSHWRVRCQRDHLVDENDELHHLTDDESRHLFQSYVEFAHWLNEEWIAKLFKEKSRLVTAHDVDVWQQEYNKLEQLYKLSQTQLSFFQTKQDELQKQRQRDYLKWLTNPDIIAELSKHPKLPTLYRQIFEAKTLGDIQPCLDEENWKKLQKLRLLPTLEPDSYEARALANWFRHSPIEVVAQLLDNLLDYEKNILRHHPNVPVAIPEDDELLMTILRQTIISHLAVQHLPYFSIKTPVHGFDLLAQLGQAQQPAYATMYFLLLQGASYQQLDFQAMPVFIELIQQLMELDKAKLLLLNQAHQNLDSLQLYQRWWRLEQAAAATFQHQFAQALQKELVPLVYFSPTEDMLLTVGSYPGGRRQLLKRCDEQRVVLGSFIVGLQSRPERESDASFNALIEDMRKFYIQLQQRLREAEHVIGVDDALLAFSQEAQRYQAHFKQYKNIPEGIKKCLQQIHLLLSKYARATEEELEKCNSRQLSVVKSNSPLVRRVVEPMLHTIQVLSDTINSLKESQSELIEAYWQQSIRLIDTQKQLEASQRQNDTLRQELDATNKKVDAIEVNNKAIEANNKAIEAKHKEEIAQLKAEMYAMFAAQFSNLKGQVVTPCAEESLSLKSINAPELSGSPEVDKIRVASPGGNSFTLFKTVDTPAFEVSLVPLARVEEKSQSSAKLDRNKG